MRRALLLAVATALLVLSIAPSAEAELVARGNLFVRFKGGLAPRSLPRDSLAPISVSVDGIVRTLSGERPPALRQISIELNRGGVLNGEGLPVCRYNELVSTPDSQALANCRGALVGSGSYLADTAFPEQLAFPSSGHILAFNSVVGGRPAILAHVYGTAPVPISYTLPFVIGSLRHGTYGTVLTASLPRFTSKWGYVTGISLDLGGGSRSGGRRGTYLTASCPAPAGFPGATFPLSRVNLGFAGHRPLSQTLTRSCTAQG